MMDIYEALVHLQYPKITLINSKDTETEILGGENRICLLSWLLQQNPKVSLPLLNKLKGEVLEEELFKYYSQIGICRDKEQLLGKCSLRSQQSTLKLLLLFIKNIYTNQRLEESNNTAVNDTLQSYFEKNVNILPNDFSLNTKLTSIETSKYIEETRKNVNEIQTKNLDSKSQSFNNTPELLNEEKLKEVPDIKNDKCKTSLENFTKSFKNLDTESKKPQTLRPETFNMNKRIDDINLNFTTIQQALNCKEKIANLSIPTGLRKLDAPLTETIDESVFWLQRVSNAQTEVDEL